MCKKAADPENLTHSREQDLTNAKVILDQTDQFRIISDTFRNLGDTTRIRIFWLLCHYEACVAAIAALLEMTSPAVSHHLKALKNNGLIYGKRNGKEVYYHACDTTLCNLLHQMIEQVMEIACPDMESLPEYLDHSHECPDAPNNQTVYNYRIDHNSQAPHNCQKDRSCQSFHNYRKDRSCQSFYNCQNPCESPSSGQVSSSDPDSAKDDPLEMIHQVHKLLTDHMEKRWTVEELARMFLVNPTTLKNLFKETYGNSIASHIREHRMERAARLLETTVLPLGEIARETGYASQSKFTAAFKNYYHMLPREYRKKVSFAGPSHL